MQRAVETYAAASTHSSSMFRNITGAGISALAASGSMLAPCNPGHSGAGSSHQPKEIDILYFMLAGFGSMALLTLIAFVAFRRFWPNAPAAPDLEQGLGQGENQPLLGNQGAQANLYPLIDPVDWTADCTAHPAGTPEQEQPNLQHNTQADDAASTSGTSDDEGHPLVDSDADASTSGASDDEAQPSVDADADAHTSGTSVDEDQGSSASTSSSLNVVNSDADDTASTSGIAGNGVQPVFGSPNQSSNLFQAASPGHSDTNVTPAQNLRPEFEI
jgi:hypothetical protein